MNSQKLLFIGMFLGLALALLDLLYTPDASPSGQVLATVGQYTITQEQFNTTVSGIESESQRELSSRERKALLDRMVEEYLLIEYAKSQDVLMTNPMLRRQAVDSTLQTLREQAASMEPSPQELQQFAYEQANYFGIEKQAVSANADHLPWEAIKQEWQRRQAEVLLDSLLDSLQSEHAVSKVEQP